MTHEGLREILDGNFTGDDVRFDLDPLFESPSETRECFLKDLKTLVLQAGGHAADRPLDAGSREPWHKRQLAEVALCFFELGKGRRIAPILTRDLIRQMADAVRAVCSRSLKAHLQFDEKSGKLLLDTFRGAGEMDVRDVNDLADLMTFHTQFTSIRPMELLPQMQGTGPCVRLLQAVIDMQQERLPAALAWIEQDVSRAGGCGSLLMNWIALCIIRRKESWIEDSGMIGRYQELVAQTKPDPLRMLLWLHALMTLKGRKAAAGGSPSAWNQSKAPAMSSSLRHCLPKAMRSGNSTTRLGRI